MNGSADLKFRKDKWHACEAGKWMIRGKNVNEMQISAELFYQWQCKLERTQRWRGKVHGHKHLANLQGVPVLLTRRLAACNP